jgi:hypothetical protein
LLFWPPAKSSTTVTSMDAVPLFSLDLIEQHWCEPDSEHDPSQGGRLRVVINGILVIDGEQDDIGVARSALALSRTLLSDHTLESPVAEQLVLHDCGFATTLGSCGIGANWWVRHDHELVRLDDVVRNDTAGRTESTSFPKASCVVPYADYEAEVVRLARAVLDFAANARKEFTDDFDQSEWIGWQVEITNNLAAAAQRHQPSPELE